jgi:outer membrane protein assembly factor BamB
MRRVAAGVAGGLSLVAAAMLATVWYDDGTAALRGPLVLGPVEGAPDHVTGLGWTRTAAVATVLAVLVAVPALLSVLRSRPRPPRPGRVPAPPGGPTTTPPPPAPAHPGAEAGAVDPVPVVWAAVLSAAAAGAAGMAAWRLGVEATPALARVAVVLAGAALAWALVPTRARVAVPVVALAVAVAAPLGGPWFVHDRLVTRTTTDAAPPATGTAGPVAPGRVLTGRDVADAGLAGPYAVLRVRDTGWPRIVVADAATLTERWSYRKRDRYLEVAVDLAGGTLVIGDEVELRAFDLASGRPLWNRRDAAALVGGSNDFDDFALPLPGLVLLQDQRASRLRALDPRTGELRWTRTGLDGFCGASAEYARAGDVLVMTSLCTEGTVTGLRVADGTEAWRTELGPGVRTTGSGRRPLVSGGVVGVWLGNLEVPELAGLDAAGGAVLWTRPSRAAVLPAVVAGDRFVLAEQGAGVRRRAVGLDPRTGRAAWTTPLPDVPASPDARSDQKLTGTDGDRFYVLTGAYPGGAGSTRLSVVDGSGRLLGSARFDAAELQPDEDGVLAGVDGRLVVLPTPRLGGGRVSVLTDGPAFAPATRR